MVTYVIIFGRFDIILKNLKFSFYLFICFFLNFIIFRNRVTSIWYHSIISIRNQVIILVLRHIFIRDEMFILIIRKIEK